MGNDYDEFNSWKTLIYAEECRAILDGQFLPPVVLHIYPTNRCNANCHFCIMKEEKKIQATLDQDVFRRLLLSAHRMGVRAVHVTGGGEPTLYPHLELVDDFPRYKVLSTNGTFLSPSITKIFDRIRISLNAGTKEIHKAVTGMDNFDEIIENIKIALKVKRPETQIGIGFVVSDKNWEDVFNVCKLANNLGVDFVHIRPAYFSESEDNNRIKEIIKPAYHLCEAAREFSKVRIFAISEKFDGYWTPKKYSKCLASPLHAVVTATGEFIVCQDVFIRFGNLNRHSFEEIWGGREHKAAIEEIQIDKCPRCVMTKCNEIMENVFIQNKIRMELL